MPFVVRVTIHYGTLLVRSIRIVCLLVLALLWSGCLIPPSATLQGARVAESGQFRVTPYYSKAEVTVEESSDKISEYGGLLGVGAGDGFEFQARFDRFDGDEDDDAYNFAAIGLKAELVNDVLALVFPAGMYFGGGIASGETLTFMPGLIGTAPINKNFEISGSAKVIWSPSDDLFTWFSAGLGLAISSDVTRWAIIPEVDWSWETEDEVDYSWFRFGVALAFMPGGKPVAPGVQ